MVVKAFKVERFLRTFEGSDVTMRIKEVTLPEGSKLKQLGIDNFRYSIDSDGEKYFNAYKATNCLANDIGEARDLIKIVKKRENLY